ncbi:MAG: hypothetical protein ACM3VX_06535 [Bacteroidota bacterium]
MHTASSRTTTARLFERILISFAVPGTPLSRERLPAGGAAVETDGGGNEVLVGCVWPFSAALAAANAQAARPRRQGAAWRPVLKKRLVGERRCPGAGTRMLRFPAMTRPFLSAGAANDITIAMPGSALLRHEPMLSLEVDD